MAVDLGRQLGFIEDIVVTSSQPDIGVWSTQVIMFELRGENGGGIQ